MKKLYLLIAFFALVSCTSESITSDEKQERSEESLKIADMKDRCYEFSTYGGTESIQIGEGGWTLENITVSGETKELTTEEQAKLIEQGEYNGYFGSLSIICANNVITLDMPLNNDVIADRSFSFNIAKGNAKVKISGTQQEASTGYWGDYLGLGTNNEICFTNEGGSKTIRTKIDAWDILNVSVNGENFDLTSDEHASLQNKDFERKFNWLTVKRDNEGLKLTADPLASGEREFKIQMLSGNYTGAIYGWQGDANKTDGGLIGLSRTSANFTSHGGSATFKTQYDGWIISEVSLNGKHYQLSEKEQQVLKGLNSTYTFEWLTITHNAEGLIITANQNSGGARQYSLILSKGLYCKQQISGSQTGCFTTTEK